MRKPNGPPSCNTEWHISRGYWTLIRLLESFACCAPRMWKPQSPRFEPLTCPDGPKQSRQQYSVCYKASCTGDRAAVPASLTASLQSDSRIAAAPSAAAAAEAYGCTDSTQTQIDRPPTQLITAAVLTAQQGCATGGTSHKPLPLLVLLPQNAHSHTLILQGLEPRIETAHAWPVCASASMHMRIPATCVVTVRGDEPTQHSQHT
jgi:hypothetical protein